MKLPESQLKLVGDAYRKTEILHQKQNNRRTDDAFRIYATTKQAVGMAT